MAKHFSPKYLHLLSKYTASLPARQRKSS